MAKKTPGKPPLVVSRHGSYRFRRGMVTGTVLQMGLDMDHALLASEGLRLRLLGRGEITTDQLEAELYALLEERFGFKRPAPPPPPPPAKQVRGEAGVFPFSRGVLVRRMVATGLSVKDAMVIVEQVAIDVTRLSEPEIPERVIDEMVERLLSERYGPGHARRYRVTTVIRYLERPVILLIGGAVGTGKSSLATELAYRLGIRKVTSTDMIRETMRTVLSPEVVPGLHDHSFRGIIQGRQVLSDPRERVLAGFRQQAAQVAVGVRAAIRRALREQTHMIIEGTHLLPPYTQLLPAGDDLHMAGFVLSVQSRKKHKKRFPERARNQPDRASDTYLDAFQSVRWIHDDILRLVEEHDAYVIENSDLPNTITAAVEYLSRVIPLDVGGVAPPRVRERAEAPTALRTLMVVLDGLADEPSPALAGLTPLAAAHVPVLSRLAGAGAQGLLDTTPEGETAHTDVGLETLLWDAGTRPKLGRGVLEALGAGLPVTPNSILLRGNMATVGDDGVIIDRRAGRIRTGVADLLVGLKDVPLPGGVTGHIFAGHEHRVVVMLTGQGLSDQISDTDPGATATLGRALPAEPTDGSPEAARTGEALAHLLRAAHRQLQRHPHNAERAARGLHPANAIITRGAGAASALSLVTRTSRRSAIVSGCPTALGVGRAAGLTPVSSGRMTGNLDTDLDHKFAHARRLLADHELVAVHLKGTDIAAHDRRPIEKRDFISQIDAALGRLLDDERVHAHPLRVVVTADHGTSSLTGEHLQTPVPLLISKWDPSAELAEFSETSAATGELGVVVAAEFQVLLWSERDEDLLGR